MTNNKRLEAIKAKAEGVGLEFSINLRKDQYRISDTNKATGRWRFWIAFWEDALEIATTLLDALDPDAVRVEINPIHNCYHCDLFNDTNCKHLILNPVAGAPVKVPGPDCLFNKMPLGEDEEYILVRRKVVR